MNSQNHVHILIPGTQGFATLYGKRNCRNDSVKDFKARLLFWIVSVDLV
jgi:hypothetical protein